MGVILSGADVVTSMTIQNASVNTYTNVKIFVFDSEDSRSAKKIALGGNGINENVGDTYVFASLDGLSWTPMKGLSSYLQVVQEGTPFNPSAVLENGFYLKISVPSNIVLNFQELALHVEGTIYN